MEILFFVIYLVTDHDATGNLASPRYIWSFKMLILHQKVRNCSGGASNVSFCRKATAEEEKQDLLNPGSRSCVDTVAMGTGVGVWRSLGVENCDNQ